MRFKTVTFLLLPEFDSRPPFLGYFGSADVEKTITYVNFSLEKA